MRECVCVYLGCRGDDGDDVPYDVSYSTMYTDKKYATKPYRARDLFVRMFMLTAVEKKNATAYRGLALWYVMMRAPAKERRTQTESCGGML